MKTITVDTLFGPETISVPRRLIKLRQVKAVYQALEIREDVAVYMPADRRYSAPQQIADLFSFLLTESKEYFFTLHLDGKNRIACMDCVSVGSLNQSIVHPREVFKTALVASAAAIVLVHNLC